MLKACLGWIGLYFVLSLALTAWFFIYYPEAPPDTTPRLPPAPFRASGAAAAGFASGIPAFLGLAGLIGIRTRLRERALTLKRAESSEEPRDGSIQAFVGRIVSDGQMLVAPLSQKPCVFYEYVAAHQGSGKSPSEVEDAKGYALCSTHLETGAGPFDIRAYLEPEFAAEWIEPAIARARLADHQRGATLYQPSLDFARNYREMNAHLLDDDGSIRYDHGSQDSANDSTRFQERVLQDGDEVVVFGMYSATRRAIVPEPRSEVLHRARIRKGGAKAVARRFVWEAFGSGLVGVFFLAAAFGVAWAFYTQFLPSFF
jgi:hypothetical protein